MCMGRVHVWEHCGVEDCDLQGGGVYMRMFAYA